MKSLSPVLRWSLPFWYQEEIESIPKTVHVKSEQKKTAMLFWKLYGIALGSIVDVLARHYRGEQQTTFSLLR